MIEIQDHEITFRPKPWKCYLGMAVCLPQGLYLLQEHPVAAVVFFGLAVLFLLSATGRLTNVKMDADGLEYRHLFKHRRYRWVDVEGFQVRTVRSGLFVAARMLVFSRKEKLNSATGKLSRRIAGGTESIPIPGDHKRFLNVLNELYHHAQLTA